MKKKWKSMRNTWNIKGDIRDNLKFFMSSYSIGSEEFLQGISKNKKV
ncbi:MAG TPA: hypothetical protein PLS74_11200 [Bacteroidales bacterium]|jgi:hypothetical protein|nr:hypothetical protein [Bacteroidales bacterium]